MALEAFLPHQVAYGKRLPIGQTLGFVYFFIYKRFIDLFEREKEKESAQAGEGAEGEGEQGAQHGAQSQDPEIMT